MNSPNKRPEHKSSKTGGRLNDVSLNLVERRLIPRAFPSPEVVEGSESSDWALWEEAVASQSGSKPTKVAAKDEGIPDPFASVRKHGS